MKKKRVFVGISGGVDSAVSAFLLKKQGYDVVGVFIRTWHPDFLDCNEEEERRDAMRVAAHLDIPFLTFDLEDVYKKEVADYMINEYKKGRTPNPDVMCNRSVKFGAFMKKAISMGADFVATGHYAISKGGKLYKGADENKDQSYFIWTLESKELQKIIFPIGELKKSEVRQIAEKAGLPVFNKKDSQGICFLGKVDLKDFLKHYIKEKKGKVKNEKGEVIGDHDGVVFFTLGERRGFRVTKKGDNDKAYYVVDKDMKSNTLFVSKDKKNLEQKGQKEYKLENMNWISDKPQNNEGYTAQVRYHGEFLPCVITKTNKIVFENPVLASSGQSCVVYDKDVCLGGGVFN